MADNNAFVNLVLKAKNLLSKPVVEAADDTKELKTELEQLTNELDKNQQAQKAVAKNSNLNDQLQATKAAAEKTRAELADLEAAYQQTAGPAKQLADKVEAANRAVSSSEKKYQSLNDELHALQTKLKAAGAAERDLVAEQVDLASSTTSLKGELKQTNKVLETLGKNKALEKQLKKDSAALEKAKKEMKKYTDMADGMKKPTKEVAELIRNQRLQVANAERAYNATNKTLEKYKSELEVLGVETTSLAQAEEALKNKRTQSTKKIKELEAATKQLKETQAAQAKAEKLTAQADELNQALTEQKNTLKSLQEEYKQTAQPSRELEQSYHDAQAALKRYQAQQEKLELALAANSRALKKAGIETDQLSAAETRLAREHEQLAKKAKKVKDAEQASTQAKRDAAANTDLLTHATRRLAQAYTVIIAAEKAIGAVKSSVSNYGELESAITKVEKTTGEARQQVAGMAAQLQDLATEVTPTATNELLRYAEVAGQLGAKSADDIMNLVTAADALAVSTDLAGDEAVSMLTRILSMTGVDVADNIHNLSATVVELGNNFAATESEIVHMTKEMATGTASIKMSAAANAAFGVTLKENGQQAERSRSAMFEMAQVIKKATVEGGQDLINLMNVTGMTADAIEANLKDRPEQVMLAFVKGLNQIKVSGGLVSAQLEEFGITGKEATSVIEILSDNHIRLSGAIDMANESYIKGNAHIEEAAKAYADQNSEISRLINKFTQLQTIAGEAMGDELQSGIDWVNTLLSSTTNEVGELVNILADLGGSFFELTSYIDGMFNSGTQQAGLFKNVILTLDNALQGLKFSFSALTWDTAAMDEAAAKVARNQQILLGETSATYEDLKETVSQYKDVVASLTDKEREQIAGLLQANSYSADKNKLYSEITAKIIRQNKVTEQAALLEEQSLKRAALKKQKKAEAAEQEQKDAAALAAILDQVGQSTAALAAEYEALAGQKQFNLITDEQYQARLELLNQAKEKQIEQGKQLLKDAQEEVKAQQQAIAITEQMSDRVESHVVAINKEYQALNALKVSLVGVGQESEKYKNITLEIEAIEMRIAARKSSLVTLQELEGKKLSELIAIKVEHDKVLQAIHDKYEQGRLSYIEYQAQLDAQAEKTAFLTQAVGEHSATLETNTLVVEENAQAHIDAADVQVEQYARVVDAAETASESIVEAATASRRAIEEATAATKTNSFALKASADQTDLTALSTDALSDKIDSLQKRIISNGNVTDKWWKSIAKGQVAFDKQTLSIAKQTLKLRQLEEAFARTDRPSKALIDNTESALRSLKRLDGTQLYNLQSQIDAARSKMLALQDASAAALASVQDEIDRANDNLEAIERRTAEAKLKELNALLEEAQQQKNTRAISDLKETIKLTKQLSEQRIKQIRLDKQAQRVVPTPVESRPEPVQESRPDSTSTRNKTMTIHLKAGDKDVAVAVQEKDQADLLTILQQAGTISR